MKIIGIILKLLIAHVNCQFSDFRGNPNPDVLTELQNEVRFGTCGDPDASRLWIAKIMTKEMAANIKRISPKLPTTTRAPSTFMSTMSTSTDSSTSGSTDSTSTTFSTTDTDSTSTITSTSTSTSASTSTSTITSTSTSTSTTMVSNSTSDSTTDGTTVDMSSTLTFSTSTEPSTEPSTVVPFVEENLEFQTGVFISRRHLLTSSHMFVYWEPGTSRWHYQSTKLPVNTDRCADASSSEDFKLKLSGAIVWDQWKQWREPVDAVWLLQFCIHYKSKEATRHGFLTMISVEHAWRRVPEICLPRVSTVVKSNETLKWFGVVGEGRHMNAGTIFKEIGERNVTVRTCSHSKTRVQSVICTTGISCANGRGAPLVKKHSDGTDILVGVGTSANCDPKRVDRFHDIQSYMKSFCVSEHICAREPVSIGLIAAEENERQLLGRETVKHCLYVSPRHVIRSSDPRHPISVRNIECGKLTIQENNERLATCGKRKLSVIKDFKVNDAAKPINIPEDSWLVRVHNINNHNELPSHDSPGSIVSQRHVLTSAQPILTSARKWAMDGREMSTDTGCDGSFEVPEKYTKNMMISVGECPENPANCTRRELAPSQAWILKYCTENEQYERMAAVMLVELETSYGGAFPCLVGEEKLEETDDLHLYGIQYPEGQYENGMITYKMSKLTGYYPPWIFIEKSYEPGNRGGPMVKMDVKTTVFGIMASGGFNDLASNTYYYDIRGYYDVLAEYAGILQKREQIVTTLAPIIDPPSSTPPSPTNLTIRPTDDRTPTRSSTREPAPTPGPLKPDPTTDPPQKERKEAEKVYDEEDADTDLYVSEDFLDGASGRSKQWIGVALFLIFTF
ncbi:unnamed protein product [Caenorhabditis sp. 36 PRJEB53466]|nr:unnamed protein product [Caenorhabditis sp. 36 PRJEB53466]